MATIFTHQDGRQECHPLYNPTIIERLVFFLNVEELKQIRLVCKTWFGCATPLLENRAWVNLGLFNQLNFLTFFDFVPTTQFKYQNFKFCSSSWLWNPVNVDKFNTFCSPRMKSLKLTNVVISAQNFRRILICANSTLQHLTFMSSYFYKQDDGNGNPAAAAVAAASAEDEEAGFEDEAKLCTSLKLTSFTYINTDGDSEFTNMSLLPFTWNELFTCFPSLNELNLIDLSEDKRRICLTSLLQNRSRVHIKKMNIFGQSDFSTRIIEDVEWSLLHRLNLKLNTLQIDIGQMVNENQLQTLLNQQASTLQTLIMWRGSLAPDLNGWPYKITLSNLQTLEIPDSLVTSLSFVNYLPKLARLWIRVCDTCPFENLTTLICSNVENVHVHKSLTCFRIDSCLTETDCKNITNVFPKIIELKYFKKHSQE